MWTEAGAVEERRQRRSPGLTLAAFALAAALLGSVATGRPGPVGQPPVLTRVTVADTGLPVEVPDAIAGPPAAEPGLLTRSFSFGNLLRDPIALEVTVFGPGTVSPDEERSTLERMRS